MMWLNVGCTMWVLWGLSAGAPPDIPVPQSRSEAERPIHLIEPLLESTGVTPEVAEMMVETLPTLTSSISCRLLTQSSPLSAS